MPFFTHPTAFRDSQNAQNPPILHSTLFRTFNNNERLFLFSDAHPPPHSSHPSLPHLTILVLEAILEVVCVSLPGYIVARQGMFTAEMQKFTANLNVALFTPCLSTFPVPHNQFNLKVVSPILMDYKSHPVLFSESRLTQFLFDSFRQVSIQADRRQASGAGYHSRHIHRPDPCLLPRCIAGFQAFSPFEAPSQLCDRNGCLW